MNKLIEKAKKEFFQMIDDFGSDPYHLRPHVPEAEKWAARLLKKLPEADSEIVFLAVWLHDLGHYPASADIDHAIRGEERAKNFLEKQNYSKSKMKSVLHCVRSHRCRDVMPSSIEAKIVACVDSASHITESIYFDIAKDEKKHNYSLSVYAKMDRDLRDLGAFPEIQEELKELLETWKKLIRLYEKIDLN